MLLDEFGWQGRDVTCTAARERGSAARLGWSALVHNGAQMGKQCSMPGPQNLISALRKTSYVNALRVQRTVNKKQFFTRVSLIKASHLYLFELLFRGVCYCMFAHKHMRLFGTTGYVKSVALGLALGKVNGYKFSTRMPLNYHFIMGGTKQLQQPFMTAFWIMNLN